jgi:1-acyl-sn-glycerol-3-phosphate acyltransferase
VSYWLVKATLGTTLRVVWRPRVVGLENVPKSGPAIIASNHLSFSDSFFMPTVIPGRKVTFLAKAEYFTGRGIKGRFNRWFFTAVGSVPVDRSGGRASEAAVRTATRVLGEGDLLGIYPEGTRSPDGRLYRGKTGVARMALEAGVPVIPCAMIDTDRLQPPGQVMPRLMRPTIRFGEPLDFSRYAGMATDRAVLRAVTDEIMQAIMKLSGQEYVDIYASKAKAELAAAAEPRSNAGEEPEAAGD